MLGRVIELHAHRELKDKPEKELEKLLWRLLQENHGGEIFRASENYSNAKAAEVYLQMVNKGRLDRDELYDSLIGWAKLELGEIDHQQAV